MTPIKSILLALLILSTNGVHNLAYSAHLTAAMQLCAGCHGAQGEGNPTTAAPRIAGQNVAYLENQLLHFRAGSRGYHPDDKAGGQMRSVVQALSDNDLAELAAEYGKMTVSTPPGLKTDTGKDLYITTCLQCHGPQARGFVQLRSPNLTILNDWYIANQLKAYTAGWRGTSDSTDLPSMMMRTIASHISSEKDIAEVIRYINGLSSD